MSSTAPAIRYWRTEILHRSRRWSSTACCSSRITGCSTMRTLAVTQLSIGAGSCWRFGGRIAGIAHRAFREGGASTLATQIEKFRHSPGGRTPGVGEKFRQMFTASARAYRDGPDTSRARREIVTHYLNATPLGSWPGYGEVIGVPEALWIWYGTQPAVADQVLPAPAVTT